MHVSTQLQILHTLLSAKCSPAMGVAKATLLDMSGNLKPAKRCRPEMEAELTSAPFSAMHLAASGNHWSQQTATPILAYFVLNT